MAFKAYLSEKVSLSGTAVRAAFLYYDDADPQNSTVSPAIPPTVVLHSEAFSFPPSWSNADMQSQIQSRGNEVRAAKVRADALATAFPVGTLISVP